MFRYREAIGLDIGEWEAKIVYARRSGVAAKIHATHTLHLGEDPEQAAEVIKAFFEKQEWFDVPCVIGLRGEDLMLRVITDEANSQRTVKEIVDEQMEHFSTLSSSATVSQYLVSRDNHGARQIVLAVARMDTVLRQIDFVREIGLNIVDLVPGPVALYNASRYLFPWCSAPLMSVDISGDSTQVVVGQAGGISFARRFLLGERTLYGQDAAHDDQGELFSEEDPSEEEAWNSKEGFREWMAELKGCMSYYNSRYRSKKDRPKKLILSGSATLDDNRIHDVKESLGFDVARAGDLKKAKIFSGDGSFLAALGFALSGLGKERVSLSLLPDYLKEFFALRWQFKYWVAAGLALVLATVLIVFRLHGDVGHKRKMLEEKTTELKRLQQLEERLYRLESENQALSRQIVPLRTALDNRRVAKKVLDAVARSKHRDDWITLIADAPSYFEKNLSDDTVEDNGYLAEESKARYPIRRFNKLVIEGFTPLDDLSTVRAMIETLRREEMIESVDLLPDDKIREDLVAEKGLGDIERSPFAIELSVKKK